MSADTTIETTVDPRAADSALTTTDSTDSETTDADTHASQPPQKARRFVLRHTAVLVRPQRHDGTHAAYVEPHDDTDGDRARLHPETVVALEDEAATVEIVDPRARFEGGDRRP